MANEETFIQEELLKLGQKKKKMGRVCDIYSILAPSPPPKPPTYQLSTLSGCGQDSKLSATSAANQETVSYLLGAGHQYFSYLPTLNLVQEAKFLVNVAKRSIDPFRHPAPRIERKEAYSQEQKGLKFSPNKLK